MGVPRVATFVICNTLIPILSIELPLGDDDILFAACRGRDVPDRIGEIENSGRAKGD
jgi:hypothetical protein